MMADTPETILPLPSSGGSYERQEDGSLKRIPDAPEPDAPEAEKSPKKPAKKEA